MTTLRPEPRASSRLLALEGPWYWTLMGLGMVFAILPFWAGDVLPFQDYAGNMSYAAILGGAEAGSLYDRTYVTGGLLDPNGLLFFVWAWLSPLTGYLVAGKVLLSAYAIALPLSVDRLLVAAGRDRRFALASLLLVFNSSMMMGFVSFATSIPLAIFTMAQAFRFHDAPTWRRGAAVAGLAMLTFLGHAHLYLLLGIMALGFVGMLARTWRHFVQLCAPFAVSLLLFVPWAWDNFVDPPDPSALGGSALAPHFQHPSKLYSRLNEYLMARWAGRWDDLVLLGLVGVVLLGLLSRRPDALPGRGRSRLGLEAIALLLFISYLAVPEHTGVQAAIASRAITPAFLFVLGWLHMPRIRWVPAAVGLFLVLLTIVHGLHCARAVEVFNEEQMGERWVEMVDALPGGSRLAVIVEDPSDGTVRVKAHQHIYGYHFALNQGLAFSTFHRYYGRHATWRKGEEIPWPGREARPFLRHGVACWFDYLLVRTRDLPRWQKLAPRVTYMDHAARYSLWHLEHQEMPKCSGPEGSESEESAPDTPEALRAELGERR